MLNLYHSLQKLVPQVLSQTYNMTECVLLRIIICSPPITASQESTNPRKPIRLKQRAPLSYKPDAKCIASLFITKIYGS